MKGEVNCKHYDLINCKHYDPINGWCEKMSDPKHIEYCPKSPCEYAEPIEQPMTDNDIIKALKCCFAVGDCEHCAYADKPCQELMADALKLINRQKAEIEALKLINSTYEVETKRVRDIAIKEFAERLKKNKYLSSDWSHGEHPYVVEETDIDDLVKEMMEGEDEKD